MERETILNLNGEPDCRKGLIWSSANIQLSKTNRAVSFHLVLLSFPVNRGSKNGRRGNGDGTESF